MATEQSVPGNVQLRYGSTKVFERPDTRAPEVAELARDDSFSVLGVEGEYYHVQLSNGTKGFVYAHNLVGADLPPTAIEQENAVRRAAEAAHAGGGWRGALKRRLGR
jgi:hypothetical protein